jgi:hypothetical protein
MLAKVGPGRWVGQSKCALGDVVGGLGVTMSSTVKRTVEEDEEIRRRTGARGGFVMRGDRARWERAPRRERLGSAVTGVPGPFPFSTPAAAACRGRRAGIKPPSGPSQPSSIFLFHSHSFFFLRHGDRQRPVIISSGSPNALTKRNNNNTYIPIFTVEQPTRFFSNQQGSNPPIVIPYGTDQRTIPHVRFFTDKARVPPAAQMPARALACLAMGSLQS